MRISESVELLKHGRFSRRILGEIAGGSSRRIFGRIPREIHRIYSSQNVIRKLSKKIIQEICQEYVGEYVCALHENNTKYFFDYSLRFTEATSLALLKKKMIAKIIKVLQ